MHLGKRHKVYFGKPKEFQLCKTNKDYYRASPLTKGVAREKSRGAAVVYGVGGMGRSLSKNHNLIDILSFFSSFHLITGRVLSFSIPNFLTYF